MLAWLLLTELVQTDMVGQYHNHNTYSRNIKTTKFINDIFENFEETKLNILQWLACKKKRQLESHALHSKGVGGWVVGYYVVACYSGA